MRKLILTLFLLSLTPLLFFGCGEKKSGDLTFAMRGTSEQIKFIEKLSKNFTAETGIKIDVEQLPVEKEKAYNSLKRTLKTRSKSPDVFLIDVTWIPEFASNDWLESLYPFERGLTVHLQDFFDRIVLEADHWPLEEGGLKLIGLPINMKGGLLFYRKDLLKKYGFERAPRSWSELIRMATKVQEAERFANPDFYGYVWQGARGESLIDNFLEVTASGKGKLFSKEEELVLNSPENAKGLQLLSDFMYEHKISPTNFKEMTLQKSAEMFLEGNALFLRHWPDIFATLEAEGSELNDPEKVGATMLPRMAGGNGASVLAGEHISISAYSDAKWPAWKFMRFLLSYEAQKKMALEFGWNPSRRDVYGDADVLKAMPHVKDFEFIFAEAITRPKLNNYNEVSTILQKAIHHALKGDETPESALTSAHAEIASALQP